MTMEKQQEDRIAKINAGYEAAMAEIRQRRAYRMQNYYDCIDDYSWGGLCDKADDDLENRLRIKRDILIEEVERGGFHIVKSHFYQLKNPNNGGVSWASHGQYGMYFYLDGKYIGVPKRVSTLEKKGYTLERVDRTYKCVFKRFSEKGYILYKSIELIEENITIVTQETMPEYIHELPWVDYLYDNK